MEEDRMPKKIFTQELEGTRRRRRPRKGWKEAVERDFKVPGVRRWRDLVTDRKKWKDIVRQRAVVSMEEEEVEEEDDDEEEEERFIYIFETLKHF
jgi:hypothetical protein